MLIIEKKKKKKKMNLLLLLLTISEICKSLSQKERELFFYGPETLSYYAPQL